MPWVVFSSPLKRDQEIGSDTDFMQSSMEDVNERCLRNSSMCDERNQEPFLAGTSPQPRSVQRKSVV